MCLAAGWVRLGLLLAMASAVACAAAGTAAPCPTVFNLTAVGDRCQRLHKACLDQETYVMFGVEANPRHDLFQQVPTLHLEGIYMDYAGFDDVWATHFPHPQPFVRPATDGEETYGLSSPQFTSCTIPLVIYTTFPHSFGDFFLRTVVPIGAMQRTGVIDKAVTLAVSTLGQALSPWHHFLLAPFGIYPPTTLSHLSSRLSVNAPESNNPDGRHVRCFDQLGVCQLHDIVSTADGALFTPNPLMATAAAIAAHHAPNLPPLRPGESAFDDPSKLRVLVVARPRGPGARRQFINQEQVWSWCTKFEPPKDAQAWNGTSCILHELGRDAARDLSLLNRTDVLLGLHDSALIAGFFMSPGSSVVEVRPYGLDPAAADQHLQHLTSKVDNSSLFWWGVNVVNPAHHSPSLLEVTAKGDPKLWPRDRHTQVRLMALQYIFERIAITRRTAGLYQRFRGLGQNYISDDMQVVHPPQQKKKH